MNRRNFLKNLSILTGASALPMGFSSKSFAASGDYKALVCIVLHGGNDAFNMVIPASTDDYNNYSTIRGEVSIPKEDLLNITPINAGGISYGLHPSMTKLQNLFQDGKLSVITNIGAISALATKEEILQNTIDTPRQLYSHNSQQNFWQSLDATGSHVTGWAGRVADEVDTSLEHLPLNITTAGSNLAQTGLLTNPFAINRNGVSELRGVNIRSTNLEIQLRTEAFLEMMSLDHNNLMMKHVIGTQDRALYYSNMVKTGLSNISPSSVEWPNTTFTKSLKMVSDLIESRASISGEKQIFFVSLGGFDTHADQLTRQESLFTTLSEGLASFQQSLEERGVSDSVTTFTTSEFGRTLTINNDGTDHGWGSHQLVMGGAINGGKFIGEWPDLTLGGNQDMGKGRILPTTSVDQYYGTMLRWLGYNEDLINIACPNLANFNIKDIGIYS